MYHGQDPVFIDHINGNGLDNRIQNLRSVTHQQNMKNQKVRSDSSSGCPGVSFSSRDNKWRAYIATPDGVVSLGYFERKEDAVIARSKAEIEFGYHRNHGRVL